MRDDGVGVGKSSGCGCAGSLTLLVFFDGLGKSLRVSVDGVSLRLVGPVCAWYYTRMVTILRLAALVVRQGRSKAWAGARIISTVGGLF